ncbi:MAG: hypothetical protein U0930_00685 [Pirellulales bacterium]
MASSESQSPISSSQLVTELHRLSNQAQKCIRYRAVFAWLTVVLAALGVLMLVDCLFQREEFGLRWLASLTLLVATGYSAFRWLKPIQRLAISPADVARWIETHQPQWAGRILTTLELSQLQQNDGRFGSEAFRSAALQSWQQEDSQPEWDRLLDKSSLKLAAWSAVVMLLLLLLSFLVWPEMGLRSLTRVLAPWADRPWPRRDQLQFVNLPIAVGRDTVLQLEIVDTNPPLPENIIVHVRQSDSEESFQSIPAQIVGDIAVANLPSIASDIKVRAIGGDDQQMPWQTIRAVATPNWKLFQFEIKPPEYLRKIPSALERLTKQLDSVRESYLLSGQRIQVVEGSLVRFEGKLDAPVNNISVRVLRASSSTMDNSRESDAKSSATDSPWSVELIGRDSVVLSGDANQPMATLDRSLIWKFQIQSLEGVQLDCPEKWQIEVIPDSPPEVALSPMPLKSLAVGSNLHFDGVARDDWGLSQLSAKLMINEQSEFEIVLPLSVEPEYSRQVSIQNSWNFASELMAKGYPLKASDQIAFWIEAKDLRGQTVRSSIEHIFIEVKQKQLDAIASRQSSIAQQIGELLSMQRSAQQLARRNADSIKQSAEQRTQQQIDAATSVAQLQQTIQQQLSEASQSVLSSIQAQLNLVEQNNLRDSPLAAQLDSLKTKVGELAKGAALEALQQADKLQQALESSAASNQSANWSELTSALDGSQTKSTKTLSELLEGLDRTELANRQREKLLQIAEQQGEISRRTDQLGTNDQLKPQAAQAEVDQLAATQNELAGALEQWLASILQPDQSDAQQAGLRDVAQSLVDKNTASQMRTSVSSLRAQQVGEALQTQNQIQQALQAAIEKMNPGDSSELMNDLAEQAQQLQQAAKAAQQLASDQQQLARRMADPNSTAQAQQLADDQKKLLESTEQFSKQLAEDQNVQPLILEAMNNQSQAAQSAQASQMNPSAERAAEAAKQLKEVAQLVQQQAQNADRQIQQQQMFELISSVEQIALRQKELMPQYEQLVRQLQLPALPSDHGQLRLSLIKRQVAIRDQLRQLLPSAAPLAVFQWVLQQADNELTRAVAAAERNRLNPDAVNAAESGLKKLEIAINTIAENGSSKPNESKDENSEQSNGEQDQSQQQESLPPIVSLKLIRALQLELKQQTEQLDSSSAEDQSLRAAELMEQQRELAELLERFISELQTQQQHNN